MPNLRQALRSVESYRQVTEYIIPVDEVGARARGGLVAYYFFGSTNNVRLGGIKYISLIKFASFNFKDPLKFKPINRIFQLPQNKQTQKKALCCGVVFRGAPFSSN